MGLLTATRSGDRCKLESGCLALEGPLYAGSRALAKFLRPSRKLAESANCSPTASSKRLPAIARSLVANSRSPLPDFDCGRHLHNGKGCGKDTFAWVWLLAFLLLLKPMDIVNQRKDAAANR